jgi:transcriptional regulator with XRE-family HTH domain
MNVNYLEIGQRIRAARQKHGITQEKLAEMVEAGTTHISHIETGNTIPSLKMFIAILNSLNVSADELLCDNLNKSKAVYQSEITEIIEDCSEKEIRVIAETVKSMKTALRRIYEIK